LIVAVIKAIERCYLNKKNIELTCELKLKNQEQKRINDEME
jgi:hypothetical protein